MKIRLQSLLLACALIASLVYHQPHINTHAEFWRIEANPHNPGFFSYFNAVIGIVDEYDKKRGDTAGIEVDCGDIGWYYQTDKGLNWWGYYFEPISAPPTHPVTVRRFNSPREFSYWNNKGYTMQRDRAHELITKYIHVRKHILDQVTTFQQRYFSDHFVIGIHYRATDKWSEARIVPYKEMVKRIKSVAHEHKRERVIIFVATDDAAFIEYLQTHCSEKIIYTHAQRSSNQTGVHMLPSGSPHQKGEEALIDCLLLARCNLLLRTASNLSTTALQFNPRLPVIYIS